MKSRTAVLGGKLHVKVADEVWIATALLHRENLNRADFEVSEIVARAAQEAIEGGQQRPGVYVHALQHCVANRPANPGRYRMLFATGRRTRRLFRAGDPYHPSRERAKMVPEREDIPPAYYILLDWYSTKFNRPARRAEEADPVLSLRGLGKDIWQGEDPDAYVRRLREGWE